MSAVSPKQSTGDHYVAMGREPVEKDTRADTSSRSILAGFAALAGVALFAAGAAMSQVPNAKVATAGYVFMGLGVAEVAAVWHKYFRN